MRASAHRGPDDRGVISLGLVCLGSNRLSIIDLSDAGHMPMCDAEENLWIVYNGETYNFQVLREELVRCGHRSGREPIPKWSCMLSSNGASNASNVLPACSLLPSMTGERHGHACEGPVREKTSVLYERDQHVLFASELKALLHVGDEP